MQLAASKPFLTRHSSEKWCQGEHNFLPIKRSKFCHLEDIHWWWWERASTQGTWESVHLQQNTRLVFYKSHLQPSQLLLMYNTPLRLDNKCAALFSGAAFQVHWKQWFSWLNGWKSCRTWCQLAKCLVSELHAQLFSLQKSKAIHQLLSFYPTCFSIILYS